MKHVTQRAVLAAVVAAAIPLAAHAMDDEDESSRWFRGDSHESL